VLSNRPFARVLAAQGLSSLGTSVSTVALAVMVFDLTGSVLHMGGVLAAATFPLVVMTFFGGALLDRFEARRLMVVADVARAVMMLMMPLAASRSVGLIYLVAAGVGVFSALFNPSQVKLIGELVSADGLVKANSYLSIAREGAELGGYLIGGVLVVVLGYTVTFIADAASYLVSATFLFSLPASAARLTGQSLGSLLRESPRAVGVLWRSRALRTNLLLALAPMLVIMMSTPNAYGLALSVFGKGAGGFALMEAIASCGWIIGGVAASRLDHKGDRNVYVAVSFGVMAACFVGVGLSRSFWVCTVLLAVAAAVNVGAIVGSMTLFQEIPLRPDKGRIIAVRTGFGQMSSSAGLLLGGVVGGALGEQRVFVVIGVVALVLCLAIMLPYRSAMRRDASSQTLPRDDANLIPNQDSAT
jgi:MFS family permease